MLEGHACRYCTLPGCHDAQLMGQGRGAACLVLRTLRSAWLFDVGEDSQRQLHHQPIVRPGKIDRIFVSRAGLESLGLPGDPSLVRPLRFLPKTLLIAGLTFEGSDFRCTLYHHLCVFALSSKNDRCHYWKGRICCILSLPPTLTSSEQQYAKMHMCMLQHLGCTRTSLQRLAGPARYDMHSQQLT